MDFAGLILTDVDETILRFADTFQTWMEENNLPGIESRRLRQHFAISHVFGVQEDSVEGLILQFCLSKAMRSIPPEPDALEVLPRLYKAGWRFVAITACDTDPDILRARRANLHDTFGFEWEAVHCVGANATKAPILNAYKPGIWVDDSWRFAVAGAEAGHRTFLPDRYYNRDRVDDRITRVADWFEIERLIAEGISDGKES